MLKSSKTPLNVKIDDHLKNIDSTISEEDIKNIGAIVSQENNIVIQDGIIEVGNDIEDLPEQSEKAKKVPGDWNVIS